MSEYFSDNEYQIPAVYIEILGVQFGLVDLSNGNTNGRFGETIWQRPRTPASLANGFPSMITSLEVERIPDADHNIYTISMTYAPDEGEDPSYLDKLIAADVTQNQGKIQIAYGDASTDGFFSRKDEALLYGYSMTIDVAAGCLNYVFTAVTMASAINEKAETHQYPDYENTTISAIIKEQWNDTSSGFQELFPGGIFIDGKHIDEIDENSPPDGYYDDMVIAGGEYTPLEYLQYLVKLMFSEDIGTDTGANYSYCWSYDDSVTHTDRYVNGQRFMIYREVGYENNASIDELIIGGGENSPVISYRFDTDFKYLRALQYGEESSDTSHYTKYAIDENGTEYIINNSLGINKDNSKEVAARELAWYNSAAAIPYGLSVRVRGLKKSIPLISNIKVTVLINSMKHFTTGTYFVTSVKDYIDSDGYTTELAMFKFPETTDESGNTTIWNSASYEAAHAEESDTSETE